MSQYPWTLLAVYVVTTGSVQLLALWAAYSRRPWLPRALLLWVPIALLATVRAFEPALILLMSVTLTVGSCQFIDRYWPRVRSSAPRATLWRFRLADLLVLMLFLATWLSISLRLGAMINHVELLVRVGLLGLVLALLSCSVYRAAIGPQRIVLASVALTVVWIGALFGWMRCLMWVKNMPIVVAATHC